MQTVQTEETKDEIEQNLNIINNWVKKVKLAIVELRAAMPQPAAITSNPVDTTDMTLDQLNKSVVAKSTVLKTLKDRQNRISTKVNKLIIKATFQPFVVDSKGKPVQLGGAGSGFFSNLFGSSQNSEVKNDADLILIKLDAINDWIDKIKILAIKLKKALDASKINTQPVPTYTDPNKAKTQIDTLQQQIDHLDGKFKSYDNIINDIVNSANTPNESTDIDIDVNSFRPGSDSGAPGSGAPGSESGSNRNMSVDSEYQGADESKSQKAMYESFKGQSAERQATDAERQARQAENFTTNMVTQGNNQLYGNYDISRSDSFSRGGYYYPSSSSKRNRKSLKNRKKYKGKGKSRSQGRSRGGRSRRRGMSRGRGRSQGRGRQ